MVFATTPIFSSRFGRHFPEFREEPKFSACTFVECDFSRVTITRCQFLDDCHFSGNSASAELFRVQDTAVSATAFVRGLRTNVSHLPESTSAAYQEHRFVGTKLKLAKSLYSATTNEADLGYFHEAYEQLVRCSLDHAVEQHRFDSVSMKAASRGYFIWRSLPARIERRVVLTSGWLTKWGSSVTRATGFLMVLLAAFTMVYAVRDKHTTAHEILNSLLEALNVTFVAGFTAYYHVDADALDRLILTVNLVLGLYWYSLVIPVLSRRTLR
jgi:hypothetical protein